MSNNGFPLYLRDIPPVSGAVKIQRTRPDGLPDGVHCGAWRTPDDMVYKLLLCKPYQNAQALYPTQERQALDALEGCTMSPHNWEIVNTLHDGYTIPWIVRKVAYIIGEDIAFNDLTYSEVSIIAHGVKEINSRGWAVNDALSIAIDNDTYCPFVVDMSCAGHDTRADDFSHLDEWLRLSPAGTRLAMLYRNAAHALHAWKYDNVLAARDGTATLHERCQYKHAYASFNRPLSRMWATLPSTSMVVDEQRAHWEEQIPWSWLFTIDPLDAATLDRYELEAGYY